jgi:hypothetical protein
MTLMVALRSCSTVNTGLVWVSVGSAVGLGSVGTAWVGGTTVSVGAGRLGVGAISVGTKVEVACTSTGVLLGRGAGWVNESGGGLKSSPQAVVVRARKIKIATSRFIKFYSKQTRIRNEDVIW